MLPWRGVGLAFRSDPQSCTSSRAPTDANHSVISHVAPGDMDDGDGDGRIVQQLPPGQYLFRAVLTSRRSIKLQRGTRAILEYELNTLGQAKKRYNKTQGFGIHIVLLFLH